VEKNTGLQPVIFIQLLASAAGSQVPASWKMANLGRSPRRITAHLVPAPLSFHRMRAVPNGTLRRLAVAPTSMSANRSSSRITLIFTGVTPARIARPMAPSFSGSSSTHQVLHLVGSAGATPVKFGRFLNSWTLSAAVMIGSDRARTANRS
jgi:hypothetical protein